MKEKTGKIFSIASDNIPVPGCTISKEIQSGENAVSYFSLARHTDISAEMYSYHRLLIILSGEIEVYHLDNSCQTIKQGGSII